MARFGQLSLEFPEQLDWIRAKSGQGLHDIWNSFLKLSACFFAGPHFKLAIASDAAACGISGWSRISLIPDREAEYIDETKRWQPEHLERFHKAFWTMCHEIEHNEYRDILGAVHQEWMGKKGQQWGAEFHTPYHLSKLMARLTFDPSVFDNPEPVTFQEPASGAGQLVLSWLEVMAEHCISSLRLLVSTWDISEAATNMCFINLSMHGVPAIVVRGNTLMRDGAWNVYQTAFHPLACGKAEAQTVPTEQQFPLEKKLIRQNLLGATASSKEII